MYVEFAARKLFLSPADLTSVFHFFLRENDALENKKCDDRGSTQGGEGSMGRMEIHPWAFP